MGAYEAVSNWIQEKKRKIIYTIILYRQYKVNESRSHYLPVLPAFFSNQTSQGHLIDKVISVSL